MATAAPQRSRAGRAAQTPAAQSAGPAREQAHELTITIPLDRAAELIAAPVAAAGRVLSSRGGLPVYIGLGVMAAADVLEWPVAAAAGLGYAVLRRWGPLSPPRVPPAAERGEPRQPAAGR